MNCVELSLERLRETNKRLASIVAEDFQPDIVIYIEKGGYLIGRDVSAFFKTQLLGIHAVRKGNRIKEMLMPILSLMPRRVCRWLRKVELNSNVHGVNQQRDVFFSEEINSFKKENVSKILIVDDSVDTGFTVKTVKDYIRNVLGNENDIRVAALNCWKKSETIVHTDYYLWLDTILMTPMSKDAKEYRRFIELYDKRKQDQWQI